MRKDERARQLQLWQDAIGRHVQTLAVHVDRADRYQQILDEVADWACEGAIPPAFAHQQEEPGKSMRLLGEALIELGKLLPDDVFGEALAEMSMAAGETWSAAREGGDVGTFED